MRVKREKLLKDKAEIEARTGLLSEQRKQKMILYDRLKVQVDALAKLFLRSRQLEQQVLTSKTNRRLCEFFFNRWRVN
jgi:hypothetical protein